MNPSMNPSSSSSSSDESDIDRTLEDRSRALPASLSPEGTASQEVTTQESYGGQCLAMREEYVCVQEIVRRDCSLRQLGNIDVTEMWT
jgi:hypothetical protein